MSLPITIDTESLAGIDLSPLKKYVDWSPNAQYFTEPAGKEHYRLIAHICSQLPKGSKVIDIGTYTGASALAASYNKDVQVVTYDIHDHLPTSKPSIRDVSNIQVRIKNCLFDMEEISKAALVILDVDPHDGIQEEEILDSLLNQESSPFTGLLLLDDTRLNAGMHNFYNATVKKMSPQFDALDITEYGHFSGTGLLFDATRFAVTTFNG